MICHGIIRNVLLLNSRINELLFHAKKNQNAASSSFLLIKYYGQAIFSLCTSMHTERSKVRQALLLVLFFELIGTASANSVEFRGIRPQMNIEDLL